MIIILTNLVFYLTLQQTLVTLLIALHMQHTVQYSLCTSIVSRIQHGGRSSSANGTMLVTLSVNLV